MGCLDGSGGIGLESAREINPLIAGPVQSLGLAYDVLGEGERALELYSSARDLGPDDEMDLCIRQYVLLLPERQREVVALHDIAGLTHGEVSSTLGISVSNSRVLLHHGRAALKLLLEKGCELRFNDSVHCRPKPG